MKDKTESFIVREARRALQSVEVAVAKGCLSERDVIILQKEGPHVLTARVGKVERAQKQGRNLIYLSLWQREYLEKEIDDSLSVSRLPAGECLPAESIQLAIHSDLFRYPEDNLIHEIMQALDDQPAISGEPRHIPFHLGEHPTETIVHFVEVLPAGRPCIIAQTTRLKLQINPLALLVARAQRQVAGLLTEPSGRRANALLDVLSELGESADRLSEENDELRQYLERLKSPPLEHAVVVGPRAGQEPTEDEFVVGAGGGRFTVKLATASPLRAEDLRQGKEVLLNEKKNIVDVCGEERKGEAVEVINVLSAEAEGHPPRLQVRVGGGDLIVECGRKLATKGVGIGDLVRVDLRARMAFERLPHHETGELELEEVPNVTYEQIGGLEKEIEQIRDVIELPYLHAALYQRFHRERPKGVLLYGPPGCGKTMIAKAMANGLTRSIQEYLTAKLDAIRQMLTHIPTGTDGNGAGDPATDCDGAWDELIEQCRIAQQPDRIASLIWDAFPEGTAHRAALRQHLEHEIDKIEDVLKNSGVKSYFLNIKGPELLTKWVGETELKIRKVFEMAKKRATFATPVVLFFDEMEALFRKRGSGISSDVELTIVPMFLSEMDGVEEHRNVIVVGATNRHDLLDPAIKRQGRLDKKIFIGRPEPDQAQKILMKCFYPWGRNAPQGTLPLGADDGRGFASADELVKVMVDEAVALLYNDRNLLCVRTRKGEETVYPLRELVSGALLDAMVGRASQNAIKQAAATGKPAAITPALFHQAVKEELAENKDHLIENLPDLGEEGFEIELRLIGQEAQDDKWDEPKRHPFLLNEPALQTSVR